MIRRVFPIVCLLGLAGCQSPQVSAHIESVNAEYRQLEDYVYSLEEENARLCAEVEMLKQRGTGTGTGATTSEGRGGIFRRPTKGTPKPPGSGPVEPPTIVLPESAGSGASSPSPSGIRSRSQRPPLSPPLENTTPPVIELPPSAKAPVNKAIKQTAAEEPVSRPMPPRKPADSRVTHLYLEPQLTGGADFDGQPGDDGLIALLQPRNSAEQCVPQAGTVSVVVLDPSRQGEAARVARWDFDAKAVAELQSKDPTSPGIRLELPWPATAPASQRLKLFVRYETADGRKLQTDREILLSSPGQVAAPSSRWTPRPAERQRPVVGPVEQTAASVPLPAAETAPAAEKPLEAMPGTPAGKLMPPASLSDDEIAEAPPRVKWSPNR